MSDTSIQIPGSIEFDLEYKIKKRGKPQKNSASGSPAKSQKAKKDQKVEIKENKEEPQKTQEKPKGDIKENQEQKKVPESTANKNPTTPKSPKDTPKDPEPAKEVKEVKTTEKKPEDKHEKEPAKTEPAQTERAENSEGKQPEQVKAKPDPLSDPVIIQLRKQVDSHPSNLQMNYKQSLAYAQSLKQLLTTQNGAYSETKLCVKCWSLLIPGVSNPDLHEERHLVSLKDEIGEDLIASRGKNSDLILNSLIEFLVYKNIEYFVRCQFVKLNTSGKMFMKPFTVCVGETECQRVFKTKTSIMNNRIRGELIELLEHGEGLNTNKLIGRYQNRGKRVPAVRGEVSGRIISSSSFRKTTVRRAESRSSKPVEKQKKELVSSSKASVSEDDGSDSQRKGSYDKQEDRRRRKRNSKPRYGSSDRYKDKHNVRKNRVRRKSSESSGSFSDSDEDKFWNEKENQGKIQEENINKQKKAISKRSESSKSSETEKEDKRSTIVQKEDKDNKPYRFKRRTRYSESEGDSRSPRSEKASSGKHSAEFKPRGESQPKKIRVKKEFEYQNIYNNIELGKRPYEAIEGYQASSGQERLRSRLGSRRESSENRGFKRSKRRQKNRRRSRRRAQKGKLESQRDQIREKNLSYSYIESEEPHEHPATPNRSYAYKDSQKPQHINYQHQYNPEPSQPGNQTELTVNSGLNTPYIQQGYQPHLNQRQTSTASSGYYHQFSYAQNIAQNNDYWSQMTPGAFPQQRLKLMKNSYASEMGYPQQTQRTSYGQQQSLQYTSNGPNTTNGQYMNYGANIAQSMGYRTQNNRMNRLQNQNNHLSGLQTPVYPMMPRNQIQPIQATSTGMRDFGGYQTDQSNLQQPRFQHQLTLNHKSGISHPQQPNDYEKEIENLSELSGKASSLLKQLNSRIISLKRRMRESKL